MKTDMLTCIHACICLRTHGAPASRAHAAHGRMHTIRRKRNTQAQTNVHHVWRLRKTCNTRNPTQTHVHRHMHMHKRSDDKRAHKCADAQAHEDAH